MTADERWPKGFLGAEEANDRVVTLEAALKRITECATCCDEDCDGPDSGDRACEGCRIQAVAHRALDE